MKLTYNRYSQQRSNWYSCMGKWKSSVYYFVYNFINSLCYPEKLGIATLGS